MPDCCFELYILQVQMVRVSSTCDLLFPYASFFIILQQCAQDDQIMLSSSKLRIKFTVETKLPEQTFVLLPYNLISKKSADRHYAHALIWCHV